MTAGDVALLGACLALVTWAAWRWAAVLRLPRAVDVLVATGVLVYGTIVGTVLLVGGVMHALSTGPVAAAALGTAVLAAATTATRDRRARVRDARHALWAALRGLASALRSPLVAVLALATAAAVGYRLAIAATLPALDWDALAYHLPMADYWLQEHRVLDQPVQLLGADLPGGSGVRHRLDRRADRQRARRRRRADRRSRPRRGRRRGPVPGRRSQRALVGRRRAAVPPGAARPHPAVHGGGGRPRSRHPPGDVAPGARRPAVGPAQGTGRRRRPPRRGHAAPSHRPSPVEGVSRAPGPVALAERTERTRTSSRVPAPDPSGPSCPSSWWPGSARAWRSG